MYKRCPSCNSFILAQYYAKHREVCKGRLEKEVEVKEVRKVNPSVVFVKAQLKVIKDKPGAYYRYLLRKGMKFEGAVHSKEFPEFATIIKVITPKVKLCYYNAQILTLLSKGKARYFEGIGTCYDARLGFLLPTPHAWNVVDGKAIDLTWEVIPNTVLEKCCYIGIEVPYSFLVKEGVLKIGVAEMMSIPYLVSIKVLE